jgi:hypothetical protein
MCQANTVTSHAGHIDLIGCTVRNSWNVAVFVTENEGGPIESVYIADCQFLDNSSNSGAGALAVSTANGGTVIRECLFKGNVAYGTGSGALGLGTFGSKTVENCIFIENQALGSNGTGGGLSGGGIPLFVVRGNTFVNNAKIATPPAGGSVRFNTYGLFENNIVVGSEGGAAISAPNGIEPSCNVYWDNSLGVGIPLSPTDREIDPQFCDAGVYDLTLRTGSPCLPDDPLGCGLIGALGQGCGTVSVDSKSWGQIKGLYRE